MRKIKRFIGENSSKELVFAICISIFYFFLLVFMMRNWAYDDPYITYRYAENLANGKGFVYNINQRILSTTTPFFTMLLAVLQNPWLSTHAMAVLIGAFSLAASGFVLWLMLNHDKAKIAAWFSLLIFPLFPTVIHTISSETPLYIFTGLLAIYLYQQKKYNWSAFFAGIIILIRPDGAVLSGLLILVEIIRKRNIPWKFGMIIAFVNLPWIIFAWLYFGNPLPVTLFVKQSQGEMSISQLFAPGFFDLITGYLNRHFYKLMLFLFFLGLVCLGIRKSFHKQIVVIWVTLYFIAYWILGVTRYYWYYAPIFPALTIISGYGLEWVNRVNFQKKARMIITTIAMAILLGFQLNVFLAAANQSDNRIQIYKQVGLWIAQNTPQDSRIGLLEVGIIGYYADRTLVDFAGLIQPEVATIMEEDTSYQDTAIWTIRNFDLDYVVLHRDFLPNDLLTNELGCKLTKTIDGSIFNYASMDIYKCFQQSVKVQ